MENLDEQFVEGFLLQVKEAGASDEEAVAILEQHQLLDLLEKDAAFREGFLEVMEKEGQHFWKNVGKGALGGAGVGGLAGGMAIPGAVVGGLAGGLYGTYKNLTSQEAANARTDKRRADFAKEVAEMRGLGLYPEERKRRPMTYAPPPRRWGPPPPRRSAWGDRYLPSPYSRRSRPYPGGRYGDPWAY